MGYWKNHNHEARRPRNIPWPPGCRLNETGPSEENVLFGLTWLEILGTMPRGDMCIIAAHQLIATWLNLCNGACVPEELVPEALDDLPPLLNEWCPHPGLPPPGPDATEEFLQARRTAQRLAEILDTYNNGILLGPGHCETIVESAEKGKTSKKNEEQIFENLTVVQNRRLNATLILSAITLGLIVLAILCWIGGMMIPQTNERGYKRM
jgi:hypothetical protein